MSHYGIYKTSIKLANAEIAKRAVELVARKYNSIARDSIMTYYKPEKVLSGFNCDIVKYGIGVRIENNKLVIVGDSYKSKDFDKIRKEIEDRYTAICFTKALNKMGYSVKTTESKLKQEIVLEGTR